MATVNQPNQDEEQGNSNQNNQQSSVTPVASASPSSSGGSKQSSAPYNPSSPTSSGNFTNLKSYLNANNNGQDFSNQVNQNLQQQGTNLNNNIQGASNQFNTQVQSNLAPVQQNYQAYQQIAGNNDPNSIVNYATQGNNAQNIQSLENASYTGPKTLNDLSGNYNGAALQSQVGNYQNLANDTNTEPGRMNLLQSLYGNQNYGQGQQTLDNVFLQGNNFGNVTSQANQLNNAYNTAANNSALSAQNAANNINQVAQGTVNSLNSAVGNQGQNLQNNFSNALNTQNQEYTTDQAALQKGMITQALANQLGLTGNMDIYNVDPSQYLQKATNLTAQNTATAQDYSNVAALKNLLQNHANAASSQILSQYSAQPDKLLTSKDYLNYDNSGLQTAAQQAAQAYQDALANNGSGVYGYKNDIDAVNALLPLVNPNNGYANGANVLEDPKTLAAKTYAQLGVTGPQQSLIPTDPRLQPAYNTLLDWAKSKGYQVGNGTLNSDQQSQISNLQQQINNYKQNNAAPSVYSSLQDQINGIQNSVPQQITDANFYKNENPLNFIQQNMSTLRPEFGYAPGAEEAMDALQGIIGANNAYTPLRQLQISPDEQASS